MISTPSGGGNMDKRFKTQEAEEVLNSPYTRPGKTPYWINLYYSTTLGKVVTCCTDYTTEYYARNNISTLANREYLKTVKIWR